MAGLDRIVFGYLNDWAGRSSGLDTAVIFCAEYLIFWMALALIMYVAWRWKRDPASRSCLALAAAAAFVSRIIIAEPLRITIARSRPYEVVSGAYQLIDHAAGKSFPSGHATIAFALAAAVFAYNRRAGAVFFVAAVVVGAARIMAGIHWPSDIAGGAVVGIGTAWAIRRLAQKRQGSARGSK